MTTTDAVRLPMRQDPAVALAERVERARADADAATTAHRVSGSPEPEAGERCDRAWDEFFALGSGLADVSATTLDGVLCRLRYAAELGIDPEEIRDHPELFPWQKALLGAIDDLQRLSH